MAKYWRKDITGQEEMYEGETLEILFLLQFLDEKDYGVYIDEEGCYCYNDSFSIVDEEEEE